MNPYNFSMLLFASCTFTISMLIFFKRKDEIAKFYFMFCSITAIWACFWAFMVSENVSYKAALMSSRLSHSVGGLVGISWFHFCLIISGEYFKYKKLLAIFYLSAFISILFFFTPHFVPEVVPVMSFKHYTKTGIVLDLYMVIFILSVGLGFLVLYHKICTSKDEEKKQVRGLFISTLIGFAGGFCTILPIYGVNLPPYTVFMIPIYPFVMAYFMIHHRLFDVEAVVQAFQKEKLATIGLLAASVNHEIRNPLYAVKGLLETYLENKKEGLPGKNPDEMSEKALAQLNRALEVIGKLNRFAKPAGEESGQVAYIPEAIQVVLDLISNEFELDKIHIKNQVGQDTPKIQADQRQLEEILFNLIVNACYAMSNGGELTISNMAHNAKVIITISDTGTGISSEQAKHLFEPFHTTKGEKGTGLGLYITKQLIERNGGKITVQSKPGQGTSFILEFKAK